MRFFTSVLAAASTLYATVSAQLSVCPVDGEFCMRVGVPQVAASSGRGNIYFQLQALESYAWAGFGTGSRMSGSSMFIIYADGSGNVTVSPRKATGNTQPKASSDLQIKMLDGSGVDGGIMTANFLCSNCAGVIDLTGQNSFIAGYKSGRPINSPSVSAAITQHDSYTGFNLDMSSAKALLAADVNPFSETAGNNTSNNGGIQSGNSAGASVAKKSAVNLILLHGIIMAIVFVFMYPVGASLMPLLGKWFVHAGWQMLAFMGMWAGFGVGYIKAKDGDKLFKQPHTILGTVVCVAMVIQPIIGVLHHRYYKKHQTRGAVSYVHIWYGRLIMFMGIINGGLGLKLANASSSFTIAYSVLAALIGIAYAAASYVGEMRRSRNVKSSGGYQPTYSPTTGTTQAYKPSGRVQYSPVGSTFPSQGRPQQPQQYQYAPRDQYQSNNQYGSYR